jgi:hypothetical protein
MLSLSQLGPIDAVIFVNLDILYSLGFLVDFYNLWYIIKRTF